MNVMYIINRQLAILFSYGILLVSCDEAERVSLDSRIVIKTYEELLMSSNLIMMTTLNVPKTARTSDGEYIVYDTYNTIETYVSRGRTLPAPIEKAAQSKHACDTEKIVSSSCEVGRDGGQENCKDIAVDVDPCPLEDEYYFPPSGVPLVIFAVMTNEGPAGILMAFQEKDGRIDMSVLPGGQHIEIDGVSEIAKDPRFGRQGVSAIGNKIR
jgi:hypothetical protein